MPIVVDCSVVAAWTLSDERSDWTDLALAAAITDGAVVPPIFWYEIRNIVVVNERRGRIASPQGDRFLTNLDALTTIDQNANAADIMLLARNHRLTVYDASYLELAKRLGVALMTLDNQLIDAAAKTSVPIWQP